MEWERRMEGDDGDVVDCSLESATFSPRISTNAPIHYDE